MKLVIGRDLTTPNYKETTVKLYTAKTVFNEPKFYPDGQYGPYYSMMIELPEGAPGTQYDEKYDRIYAYMSFDADAEEADALVALPREAPLQVAWTGSKYKPALSDEAINSAPARAATTPASTAGTAKSESVFEPVSPTLMELGYDYLATRTARRILSCFEAVAQDDRATDLSNDEKLRVAISGVIQANRDASRELVAAIERAEHEAITGVDKDELPGSLLNKIADLLPDKYDSPAEVVESLKELGLSSKDIDPDDPQSWYELYAIAKSVDGSEVVDVPDDKAEDAEESFDDDLPPF